MWRLGFLFSERRVFLLPLETRTYPTPLTNKTPIATASEEWTTDDARAAYGIREWGAGYFDIAESGEVHVYPGGKLSGPSVSLMEVVSDLKARGMEMPVLLRFGDILDAQIRRLHEGFAAAIGSLEYGNCYRGVFPIKVNQQQHVIEEITRFGKAYDYGLEAGSKPELIAALTYLNEGDGLLICNGYKDSEFIDLALHARKLGINSILVIEAPAEVETIIERSRAFGVRPHIGIRVKLSSKAGGHWQDTGGDRSVFGLNAAQVIQAVDQLREAGMLDCLEMLHYHLGSQIPDIRDIRTSVMEAARVYVGLIAEGAPMGKLDLGGGLAVDYDGSHTNFEGSRNYTLEEYCLDVVDVVKTVMDESEVPHPILITESGRATVAYHSVLLFNILDVSRYEAGENAVEVPEGVHEYVTNLAEIALQPITAKNCQECYNDAVYYRDEARQIFKHGAISLRERAAAEQSFWSILRKVVRAVEDLPYVPEELREIGGILADIYYGNFSLFQSLPDSWAIDQLFPIMPIHRHGERPTREAVLSDITCDCDGKIDRFIDLRDVKRTLPVHPLANGDEYYLGTFLVGAYQETLGDLHNLLGDTNVASLRLGKDNELEFEREIEGDTVADVLSYVEYDPKDMAAKFRAKAENAVRNKRIDGNERRLIVEAFEAGLRGYTYFER